MAAYYFRAVFFRIVSINNLRTVSFDTVIEFGGFVKLVTIEKTSFILHCNQMRTLR